MPHGKRPLAPLPRLIYRETDSAMPKIAAQQRRSPAVGVASARAPRGTGSTDSWLAAQLLAPARSFPRIVRRACTNPSLITALLAGTASEMPQVKFGSAKALWLLAEADPGLLYPHFDFFVKQLDSPNGVFRWNAERVLACLAAADIHNKLERLLDRYLSAIPGPQLIDAANVIGFSWKIARAKPQLAERIARAILGVSQAHYKTDECVNVAAGHALQSLGRFFDLIEDKRAVVAFARKQLSNTRSATRRKAEAFLKNQPAA
jgi:hypothetical protein